MLLHSKLLAHMLHVVLLVLFNLNDKFILRFAHEVVT